MIEEMSGVEEEEIEELSIGVVKTVPPVENIDADNNISKTKEVKTIEADVNSMEKYVDENPEPFVDSEKSMEKKENTNELPDDILYKAPEEEIEEVGGAVADLENGRELKEEQHSGVGWVPQHLGVGWDRSQPTPRSTLRIVEDAKNMSE